MIREKVERSGGSKKSTEQTHERSQAELSHSAREVEASYYVQRKATCACGGSCPSCTGSSSSENTNYLATLASTGKSLVSDSSHYLGSQLGMSGLLPQVKVHSDEAAAQSAKYLGARAYTLGNHIVFGRGAFSPDTLSGQRLLAHELVHVQQQRKSLGRIAQAKFIEPVHSPAEKEADQVADNIVRGKSVSASRLSLDPGSLSREPTGQATGDIEDQAKRYEIDYEEVTAKNLRWWRRLRLDQVKPFGEVTPQKTPIAYANFVYQLQTFLKGAKMNKRSKAFSQEVDGIMGPRSFYTFWYLGQMLQDSKKLRDVFVKGGG
ncbi:MAG: DUF4157 domain-containing protein, partial [Verrucomicrobiota bacterium]